MEVGFKRNAAANELLWNSGRLTEIGGKVVNTRCGWLWLITQATSRCFEMCVFWIFLCGWVHPNTIVRTELVFLTDDIWHKQIQNFLAYVVPNLSIVLKQVHVFKTRVYQNWFVSWENGVCSMITWKTWVLSACLVSLCGNEGNNKVDDNFKVSSLRN